MLSRRNWKLAEIDQFTRWLHAEKGFTADDFLEDPDSFDDAYSEFIDGPEIDGPYTIGHYGIVNHATGVTT